MTVTLVIEHLTLADLALLLPANDRTLPGTPWTPQASAVVDWVLRAEDEAATLSTTLRHVRRALEEAAL